jgi:RimJ/RimL family protein N-acetyltransferase
MVSVANLEPSMAAAVPLVIATLQADDAAAFHTLRLRGLREFPEAFASSLEEEAEQPLAQVAERLSPRAGACVFGAWQGDALIGLVGLAREGMAKLAHKGWIWGVYVAPEARGHGVAEALLGHALAHAAREWGLRQVNLGVNTRSTAAHALYCKLGFESFGLERGFLLVDGVLHDEHQMVKLLDPVR